MLPFSSPFARTLYHPSSWLLALKEMHIVITSNVGYVNVTGHRVPNKHTSVRSQRVEEASLRSPKLPFGRCNTGPDQVLVECLICDRASGEQDQSVLTVIILVASAQTCCSKLPQGFQC